MSVSNIRTLCARIIVVIAAMTSVWAGVPSSTQAATPAADATQPWLARSGKWIEVDLSSQRLRAWQNGRVVLTSAISSGVRAHPTRPGTFHIYAKYRSTRMTGPGYDLPNVPYTMYYSGSFALHGTYWHHNFGHPMSHGCINLPTGKAAWLYGWARAGTTVVIHY